MTSPRSPFLGIVLLLPDTVFRTRAHSQISECWDVLHAVAAPTSTWYCWSPLCFLNLTYFDATQEFKSCCLLATSSCRLLNSTKSMHNQTSVLLAILKHRPAAWCWALEPLGRLCCRTGGLGAHPHAGGEMHGLPALIPSSVQVGNTANPRERSYLLGWSPSEVTKITDAGLLWEWEQRL